MSEYYANPSFHTLPELQYDQTTKFLTLPLYHAETISLLYFSIAIYLPHKLPPILKPVLHLHVDIQKKRQVHSLQIVA